MEIKVGILSAFSRVWRETRVCGVGWSEMHGNLVNEKGEQQTRGRRDEMRRNGETYSIISQFHSGHHKDPTIPRLPIIVAD